MRCSRFLRRRRARPGDPPPPAAFAVEFNPRRRGDVSKNGFVVRAVDLPRGLGRPDVLVPGRREVLVGSTVGAPRLVAIDASSFDESTNVDLIVDDPDSGLGGGKGPSGGSVRGIDPGVRIRGACRAWRGAGWEGGLALTTTAAAGRSFGSFSSVPSTPRPRTPPCRCFASRRRRPTRAGRRERRPTTSRRRRGWTFSNLLRGSKTQDGRRAKSRCED